ncbi:hypothetical protein JS561_09555 [Salmonella enterica subsp. enterica serovar Infantis]|nr:hypothetical protein JS561_09555 [Salmonella enterica subsp. enterica serovar Infantis]
MVMNAACERLSELEIPHQPIPFQATHEVNQFATDLDQQLTNTLLVVNNGVEFSATQEAYFFDTLAIQFPGINSGLWRHLNILSKPAFLICLPVHLFWYSMR